MLQPNRTYGASGRAPTFDIDRARRIIADLLSRQADDLESEQLEIKGWCKDERELVDKVSDVCACLANTAGGMVLVGVSDGPESYRRFSRCPHSSVSDTWLQSNIHNLTHPPVDCSAHDISSLAREITGKTDCNLYLVNVSRTRHVGGHLNHKGVAKVRVGKECQLKYLADDDRTSALHPGLCTGDLSQTSIDWGIEQYLRLWKPPSPPADRDEFLAQARLVQPSPEDDDSSLLHPTYAALLLFGKQKAIERHAPFFETTVITETEHFSFRKNIVESVRDLCAGDGAILRSRLPQMATGVLKELVVNAYVHRCYRTPSPIVIRVASGSLEVQSPGELLHGLKVENLINGVPIYRNLLTADGARLVGLCDKVGQGIDIIFKGVLTGGFGFPEFESGANQFTARIPLAGSENFREFLNRRSQSLTQLDEIIILRLLWASESASLDQLAHRMQRKPEFAEKKLSEMAAKGMVQPIGAAYHLTPVLRRDIETIFSSEQMSLWGEVTTEPVLW